MHMSEWCELRTRNAGKGWAMARTYAWNKKIFVLSFRPSEWLIHCVVCAMAVGRISCIDCGSTVPCCRIAGMWRRVRCVCVCSFLRQANRETGFYAFLFLILAMGLLLLMIAASSSTVRCEHSPPTNVKLHLTFGTRAIRTNGDYRVCWAGAWCTQHTKAIRIVYDYNCLMARLTAILFRNFTKLLLSTQ